MYKISKSLVSVSAALALSSSVWAGYLPLTTDTPLDDKWMLIGVNGFHADGATSETAAESGAWTITDTAVRNVATDSDEADGLYGSDGTGNEAEGLYVGTATAGEPHLLGKVKLIPGGGVSQVEVRVNTSGIAFNQTDPERTVYVKDDAGNVIFAFTYRAALEGKRLEYSTNGSVETPQVRFITLKSEYSYVDAVAGVLTTVGDGAEALDGVNLTNIVDTVDYDFSDNPLDSTSYLQSTHQQQSDDAGFVTGTPSTQVFTYDAATSAWNLYDSRNTVNNFDQLQKGKGYWAKIDTDGEDTEAGLVLAKTSTISNAEYLATGLTPNAWNLISFDAQQPNIRVASTALVGGTAASSFDIYDASGVFSTTITMTGATDAVRAAEINEQILAAKTAGELPRTFNMSAVVDTTTNNTILISNEKFSIDGAGGGWTSNGATPTLAAQAAVDATTTTANAVGDQTIYGEYAVVIEPLATNTDALFQIRKVSEAPAAATLVEPDLTSLPADYIDYPITVNGKDLVIIACDEPFVIRDHTFTRVFTYNGAGTAGDELTVSLSGGAVTQTVANGADDIATYVASFNTAFNGDGVYAVRIGTTDNIAISTMGANDASFYLVETAGDNLTPVESLVSDDTVRGAIKNVYSLNAFASSDSLVAQHTTELVLSGTTIGTDDQVTLTFSDGTVVTYTSPADYDLSVTAQVQTFIEGLVAQINTDLGAGTAVEDATGAEAIGAVTITLTTGAITPIVVATVESATTAATVDVAQATQTTVTGAIVNVTNGDLIRDLKYNAVYTPNYVLDGPLYTMKAAGFTPKAMVTGTMNLNSGVVKWDSIDLSRPADEWLEAQEYNLFGVDKHSGYWAYLETDATPMTLTIQDPQMSVLGYTQHFDDPDPVTGIAPSYNRFSGTFSVVIPELESYEKTAVRVQAQYAGSNIELTAQATGSEFTGYIDQAELSNTVTASSDITLKVADGQGYKTTYPVDGGTGVIIDTTKPTTPVVTFNGPNMSLASSDDVASYFVYKAATVPPALSAAPDYEIAPEDAAAYNICSTINYGTSTDLIMFALDGDGTRVGGNASDAVLIEDYYSLVKGALVLENTNDGTVTTTSTGTMYSSTCEVDTEAVAEPKGVQLSAISDLTTAKVSFLPKSGAPLSVPNYVHLEDSAGNVVKVNYDDSYAGDTIFVQINDELYSYILPAAPTTIPDSAAVTGTLLEGQSL
jgi:hypothetical protein